MNLKVKAEIFMTKFIEAYDQHAEGRLSCEEAAELLGMSVSSFYRHRQAYEEEGLDGLIDRRIGKVPSNIADEEELKFVTRLYAARYRLFSVKHFHEFAQRDHGLKRSYNWTKNKLTENGLITKSTRGGKHRLRRERKPMTGMMLHQDGSRHRWLKNLDYDLDLIVTMDDASSKITSCFLIEEEGTVSSFRGIQKTIESEGLFCSLYTDRGSHYFHTPEANGKVDKSNLTQVGRALRQLQIKHIAAYSPEARGRSERMFGTLQNRLPQEFALKCITTIEEANKYIQEEYLPRHNAQFCVKPASSASAFAALPDFILLDDILCIEEERIVQRDNTIRYNGLILQIPAGSCRQQYIKAEVKVRQYCDLSLAVFYGHLCIGRYDIAGRLQEKIKKLQKQEADCERLFQQFLYNNKIGQMPC